MLSDTEQHQSDPLFAKLDGMLVDILAIGAPTGDEIAWSMNSRRSKATGNEHRDALKSHRGKWGTRRCRLKIRLPKSKSNQENARPYSMPRWGQEREHEW